MARGVRKPALQKLQEELQSIRASIAQYEENLEALREKESSLKDNIEAERLKELLNVMEEKGVTVEDVKSMLETREE